MQNDRAFWKTALPLFLLTVLLFHLPLSMLFFPAVRTAPALMFRYLYSGEHLGGRWLIAAAAGLAAVSLAYAQRHTLSGGVRRIPNGAFGDAHFAGAAERRRTYPYVPYKKACTPGITLCFDRRGAEAELSARTVELVSPPGGGKTRSVLLPTLLYNGHVNENTHGGGASILSIDCKGEEYQTTAAFMQAHGYRTLLLDFREPLRSMQYDMLFAVNKHIDTALHTDDPATALEARADAERHAKLLADAISAATDLGGRGTDNPFFIETAKGLITAVILIVSEFGAPEERHIVSVFRLIVELNGLMQQDGKAKGGDAPQRSRLGALLDMLPGDVRAKLYAGAATGADIRTSMNVFSSALSKLLAFLDARLEQMVCAQSAGLSAEEFIERPTCIYLLMPDEDDTAHFFATLFIEQITAELIRIASPLPGQTLPRRVLVLWDEFGQAPPCKNMESWVAAWRSRGIRLLLALQNEAQLEYRYGRERAKAIRDSIQIRMYTNLGSGEMAQELSKELGNYTVVTKSVTHGERSGSTSQSMTGRPLLSHDEIGRLPLGTWIVLPNTGAPILARLSCFEQVWPQIRPQAYAGEKRPIRPIPYLTEQKLYERYGAGLPDPLIGILDTPPDPAPDTPDADDHVFYNQR